MLSNITMYYTATELTSFTKKIILNETNWEGMVAFTIGNYRINTIAIIKLFPITKFRPVSNFP